MAIIAVSLAAVVMGALLISSASDWSPWWLVLLLFAIALATETVGSAEVPQSRALEVSGGTMAIVCAIAVLGPAPAIAIAATTVGIESLIRRKRASIILLNATNYGAYALAGGLVAGPLLGAPDSTARTAAAVVAIYAICDLVSWTIAVMTRRMTRVGPQDVRFYVRQLVANAPSTLVGALLAALAVMTYETAGGFGLALLGSALIIVQTLLRRVNSVEFELRAERDRAQAYLDWAGSPFVILDEEGLVEVINRRALGLTATSGGQMVGTHWDQVIPVADKDAFAAAIATAGAGPSRVESALLSTSGEERHVLWSVVELNSASGTRQVLLSGEDITERRRVERDLEHRAFHDPLTKLPNRAAFADALTLARDRGRGFAVLFIDLNDFKAVNDEHGHPAGDRVLCHVAARLRAAVRDHDVVARQSGDEFLVLLDDMSLDQVEAQPVIDEIVGRILERLGAPCAVGGLTVRLGASVGVAVHPRDGRDLEELIGAADQEMYVRKQRARARA